MDLDLSTGGRVVVILILIIVMIGVVFWLFRWFGGQRLGAAGARGRQPRLAVIEGAAVDGRRRLVLIRRDNVEHLLIIGRPTDVVVEQNIVRAAAAPREPSPARPPAAPEALPRAAPLGEGSMWPLQPEPAPRPEPAARHEPAARIEPGPRGEPAPRVEQGPRIEAAPRIEPAARAEPALRLEPQARAEPAPRPQRPAAAEESIEWSAEPEPALPPRDRRARAVDPLAGLVEELARVPTAPVEAVTPDAEPRQGPRRAARPMAAPPAPAPASDAKFNSAADQNLAEMAQRLEAALRRPAKVDEARPAAGAPRTAAEPAAAEPESPPPPPRAAAPAEAARPPRGGPARPDGKPAPQKSVYDNLEQEMASLLGRPNTKP